MTDPQDPQLEEVGVVAKVLYYKRFTELASDVCGMHVYHLLTDDEMVSEAAPYRTGKRVDVLET